MEQKFLQTCARHYYDRKDSRSMVKFVQGFRSMELKHEFLRLLSLLDELLLFKDELGNFMDVTNIAKMMGDILHEADLLAKAGKFIEAYELMLCYILANSLWSAGSKGWPLKQFPKKSVFLKKALSFAKEESIRFYELASTEAEIFSTENSNIFMIMIQLKFSRMYGSIRGEILCLWKLLEAHFQLDSSEYVWQDKWSDDFVEEMILKNQLSVETLFYCWTSWKDNIIRILEYLPSIKSQDIQQQSSCAMFALNYLGVRKLTSNLNDIFLLVIHNANWVKKMGDKFLKKNGRLVSIDVHCLVSAAQSYWCSELFSVGKGVLRNLEALYKLSVDKVISECCQIRTLIFIFEVSKFLLESEVFSRSQGNLNLLEKSLGYPVDCFSRYVHLDWNNSQNKEMVSFRETETYKLLVKHVIHENISKNKLTYGQIGRVAVMILGTANLEKETIERIVARFEDYPPWKEFFESLHWNSTEETSSVHEANRELHRLFMFSEALMSTYNVEWKMADDYISPSCFMTLIERLLLLSSGSKGLIFATKASFIEWLFYWDGISLPNLSLATNARACIEGVHKFIAQVISDLLNDPNGTKHWIRKSNINGEDYFSSFVLRLVVSMCLLQLISGEHLALLCDLLWKHTSNVAAQLPPEFYDVLCNGRDQLDFKVYAEAFKVIGNPLVVVTLQHKSSEPLFSDDAVVVDLTICQQRQQILEALFPNRSGCVGQETAAVTAVAATSNLIPSINSCSDPVSDWELYSDIKLETNMSTDVLGFWDLLEKLQLAVDEACPDRVFHCSIMLKDFVDPCIELLISSICGSLPQNPINLENKDEMGEVLRLLDEMKQLSSTLSVSDTKMKNAIPVIGELCSKILSRQAKVAHILDQLFLMFKNNTVVDSEPSEPTTPVIVVGNDEHVQNDLEESKGNMSENSHHVDINKGPGNSTENKV